MAFECDQEAAIAIAKKFSAIVCKMYDVAEIYLFGSYAKGTASNDSDINIAIVASDFGEDVIDETLELMRLRRKIDMRISPHLFFPEEFNDTNSVALDVKNTGIKIV